MRIMVLAAVLGLSVVGCAKKVDCGKLESKMNACGAEFVRAIAADQGQELPEGAATDELISGMMSKMIQPVIQDCRDHGGKADDADKINECLAKEDCKAFADCMVAAAK